MDWLSPISEWFGSQSAQSVGLLIGAVIALVSVLNVKSIAKKRHAIDALIQGRKDGELVEGLREIAAIDESDEDIGKYGKKDQVSDKKAQLMRYVLNHYEYMSIGIQKGIYDENILKEATCNTVISLYKQTKPFIDKIRREYGRKTLFQEFEWLSNRWKNNPVKQKRIISVQND